MGEIAYLLDTHTLLWWWSSPERLSPRVLSLVRQPDHTVYVSAGSAWEIATKHRIGKLPSGAAILHDWDKRVHEDRFLPLPISAGHARKAGGLIHDHRDPFDRVLAAQSMVEGLPVLSNDARLSALGAERIWD